MIKTACRHAVGVVIPLVVSAVLAAPAVASAASVETVQRTVSYRDLDLSRPADLARLQLRLDLAVRRMCAGDSPPSPFEMRIAYASCVSNAKAGAQRQLAQAVRDARNAAAFARAEP